MKKSLIGMLLVLCLLLCSCSSGGQDAWIGTGSVVKVDDTYYLFYTGHTGASNAEFKEKIMVARGSAPYHFERVEDWYINPPAELGQKNDFRDPQCYYDPATGLITMTLEKLFVLHGGSNAPKQPEGEDL